MSCNQPNRDQINGRSFPLPCGVEEAEKPMQHHRDAFGYAICGRKIPHWAAGPVTCPDCIRIHDDAEFREGLGEILDRPEPLAIIGQGEYAEQVMPGDGGAVILVLLAMLIVGVAMLVWAFCQ